MFALPQFRFTVSIIATLALSSLATGCYDRTKVPRSSDDPAVDTLYRHFRLTRWARPIVRGSQYSKVELVFVSGGAEKIVTSLTLGKNLDETFGMFEVLLQRLENNEYAVSLHHLEKSTARSSSVKKFPTQKGLSLWSMGERIDPWGDETMLGSEGATGASSQLGDPMNTEELILRFVSEK